MRLRDTVTILVTLLTSLVWVSSTSAHAKLLSSKPAAGESLTAAPDVIKLQFNTRVQQKMSSLGLIDPSGRLTALSPVEASEDGKTLRADLPELASGLYTVSWRALSADDHLITGEFSFQVSEPPGSGSVSDSPTSEPDHSSMDHGVQTEEGVRWPQSIVRWFIYVSMMVIGGGLICKRFVLDAVGADGRTADRSYLLIKALFTGASAVLVVCLVIALGLQTYSIFGALGSGQAYSVLSETDFGSPWLIQFASAIVVLVLMLLYPEGSEKSGTIWLWSALAAWMFMPLGASLTGHARAASSDFAFATLSAGLHMVAAAVWTGGLVLFTVLLPRSISGFSDDSRLSQLALAIRNFNRLAMASVVLLVVTGIYNTWIHVESFSALLDSVYGQVLLGKISITALMIGLGALNSFVLRPRMLAEDGQTREKSTERNFFRSVKTEVALAAVVLLLAAILALLPPAREHVPPTRAAAAKGPEF